MPLLCACIHGLKYTSNVFCIISNALKRYWYIYIYMHVYIYIYIYLYSYKRRKTRKPERERERERERSCSLGVEVKGWKFKGGFLQVFRVWGLGFF